MKPPPFEYARPESVEEALELLHQHGDDAKVLAGGQSLIPMLGFRLARPGVLVDVGRLDVLAGIRPGPAGELTIGPLTTHHALEQMSGEARTRFPVLPRGASLIGHHPIRTRGTFGGSLCHADPAAEWCVLAVLLDAVMTASSLRGDRQVSAADLFAGFLTTTLAPDELVTAVRLPRPRPHATIVEVAPRHGDFAIVAVAVATDLDPEGRCQDPRIVLGGVGATPVRAVRAEAVMAGRRPTDQVLIAAAREAAAIDPPADAHASAAHRRRLTAVLVRRAWEEIRAQMTTEVAA